MNYAKPITSTAIAALVVSFSLFAGPIHEAVEKGETEKVAQLLRGGAQLEAKDKEGFTPLSTAAYKGRGEIAKLLISKGAAVDAVDNVGGTPLLWAINGKHSALAQLLIRKGANVNRKMSAKPGGDSPLHLAAATNQTNLVTFLLKNGADVNSRNTNGFTPLHWSAFQGYKEVSAILLNHGASVNVKDKSSSTPLHQAAHSGRANVVPLLVSRGANVDLKTKDNLTARDIASRKGHGAVVKELTKEFRPAFGRNVIRNAQRELTKRGYDAGVADGLIGKKTRNAIKSFQHDIGLQVTGILNKKTIEGLGIDAGNVSNKGEFIGKIDNVEIVSDMAINPMNLSQSMGPPSVVTTLIGKNNIRFKMSLEKGIEERLVSEEPILNKEGKPTGYSRYKVENTDNLKVKINCIPDKKDTKICLVSSFKRM